LILGVNERWQEMKYFLDSAKIDEIEYAYKTFGIDGVTTNPKHIMASGKSFLTAINDITDWIKEENLIGYDKFPISVEINPHIADSKIMIEEAKKIAALSTNFVIKIPATEDGVTAARELEKEGVRTNVTLIFSPAQAILPAKNGSKFVSPFIGWKEANGEDCRQYIRDIVEIYKNYGYYGKTEIICAAVKTPKQIVDCAVAGADIVTAGLDVYKDSMKHAYTRQGIEFFSEAWDNTAV
jgi:transaldolase